MYLSSEPRRSCIEILKYITTSDTCLHIAVVSVVGKMRTYYPRARTSEPPRAPAPHSTHFITMGKNTKARLVNFLIFGFFKNNCNTKPKNTRHIVTKCAHLRYIVTKNQKTRLFAF